MSVLKSIPSWAWTLAILLIIIAMYFAYYLQNYKKSRDMILKLQNELKVGSRVILAAGIHGMVKTIEKKTLTVEIAPNTVIIVDRLGISGFEQNDHLEAEKTL